MTLSVKSEFPSAADSVLNREASGLTDPVVVASLSIALETTEDPPALTQAAQALAAHARQQAVQSAAQQEVVKLRRQLTKERAQHAVQRANAEHARRVAECLTAFHGTLLTHLTQPCFSVDREGMIVRWNPALEAWTGLAAAQVEQTTLGDLICPEAHRRLACALHVGFGSQPTTAVSGAETALTLQGPLTFLPGKEVRRITLLPLCRVPGCVEVVVALLELPS